MYLYLSKKHLIFFSLSIFIINVSFSGMKARSEKNEDRLREEKVETLYNWQLCTWPNFQYEPSKIQDVLISYQTEVALLAKKFNRLSKAQRREVERRLMALEKTALENNKKHDSSGIVQLMFLINETFREPLTKEKLFGYHKTVFDDPDQRNKINPARWRTWSLFLVDQDKKGEGKITYRPLPPQKINQEMIKLVDWFNATDPINGTVKIPGSVRAAMIYLYFESIHPFIDGNGRIGRALVKKALLQDLGAPFFNFSSNVQSIHHVLNTTQKNGDITPWLMAFINLLYKDLLNSKQQILTILQDAESIGEEEISCITLEPFPFIVIASIPPPEWRSGQ